MKKIFFITIVVVFLSSMAAWANTTISIINLNDFHGHLTPQAQIPGIVKVAGEIQKLQHTQPNPILVAGGDNYQGSAISNLTYGKPVNRIFRHLGVVASAVGDHEFDWGAWRIRRWAKSGHFSYLAANIYNKSTNKPVSWAKPYIMVKKGGEKIAFIGISTQETPTTTNPINVKKFKFTNDVQAAQHWVDYLQAGKDPAGKPDAIIALTHIPSYQDLKTHKVYGKEITNFCEHVHGIAAVLTAHSHLLVNGKINHIPVIQGYKYGKALSLLTLVFNNNHRLIHIKTHLDILYNRIAKLPQDSGSAKIYQKYAKNFRVILQHKIGFATATFLYNPKQQLVTPLGAFLAKVLYKTTHADVAILNGGLIRTPLAKGVITMADVFAMLPFDNQVQVVKLTGKSLKKILEYGILNPDPHFINAQFYGVNLTYNPTLPFGRRIVKIAIDKKPLQPEKIYSVAILDFMLHGGDGYNFKAARSVANDGRFIRNVILHYIKEVKRITPFPVTYIAKTTKLHS